MSRSSTDGARPHAVSSALRHNKLLIVLCTVLVGALIWALASARTPTYSSSAKVLVRPILGNPFSPDTGTTGLQVTIALGTEAQVVDSVPVAALSNKSLKEHWVAGSGVVTAVVPPNTQVVQIQFDGTTPQAAQQGADAVAKAYLKYRSTETANTQKARLGLLDKQARAIKASLDAAAKDAASPSASPETSQRVQLYANQLVTLQNTISSLEATGADPGTIVSPAQLPTSQSGIPPLLLALAGAVLGLLAGVTLAIWRERRDRRVRAGSDLSVAGVPLLGYLPRRRVSSRIANRADPAQPGRALFQQLRTATLATAPAPFAMAVSSMAQEGREAEVVVELGRSLSLAGYHVVLVATGADGQLERLLGVAASGGLADVLLQHDSPRQHLVKAQGMYVLPAGARISSVQELFSGQTFSNVLAQLKSECDYMLVAAPPATTATGMAIARVADGLLLVGRDRRTDSDDVADVASRAGVLGVRVLGLILLPAGSFTRVDPSSGGNSAQQQPQAVTGGTSRGDVAKDEGAWQPADGGADPALRR